MAHPNPTPPNNEAAARIAEIKRRQLQAYLHCPSRIPTAVHPFVKQMALGQPALPQSGLHTHGLVRVMLAGFVVLSSLGVLALVGPLRLVLGRPSGRSRSDDQRSPQPALPGPAGRPPPDPQVILLNTDLDNSKH